MITILRFLLVPAVVYWLLDEEWQLAFAGFLVAGVSDAVDGFVARHFNQRSKLGAYLDPMADKLLLVTTFIILTLPGIPLTNHLPVWLTILVISRDVVIVGVVAIISLVMGPRPFRPSLWGKSATATFIITSVIVMYYNVRREQSLLIDLFVWLSLALTVISGVDYFFKLRRLINGSPAASA